MVRVWWWLSGHSINSTEHSARLSSEVPSRLSEWRSATTSIEQKLRSVSMASLDCLPRVCVRWRAEPGYGKSRLSVRVFFLGREPLTWGIFLVASAQGPVLVLSLYFDVA